MRPQTSIAKITRPRLPHVLPRKRLFHLLDRIRKQAPVIWISGPAGSGKTTLVNSYLDARTLPSLWYQLDEGDADVATFFYYMGIAGKKAAPRYRQPLPLLTPEYGLGVPTFTRRYFENLCSRLKSPSVLVFDNYQQIPAESPFHDLFCIGLSALPDHIHAVVISRAEPPAVYAGMHANNKLLSIGWNDLRLTLEESNGIAKLQDVRGRDDLLEWMHEKTQGWAAGLVLLTRMMKSESIHPEAFKDVAPEKVFDYFANELFDRLDAPMQDFLLKTAFVPKITPELAETLTGNEAAGRILSDLNRRNYFTEKRMQPELSYQYHALFREFLMTRASTLIRCDELSALRSEAGKLLQTSGQTEDAAELYIQAKAWTELTALILANAQIFIQQGRNKLLEKWIVALPEELLNSVPWLLFWLGHCRLPFDPAEGRKCFERSFEIFKGQNETEGAFVAWAAIVNAIMHEWDDLSRLDPLIEWMENALKQNPSFASPLTEASITAGLFFAIFRRRPDHPSLARLMERALRLTRNAPVSLFLQVCYAAIFDATMKADLKKVESLCEEMKFLLKSSSPSPFDLMTAKVVEANAHAGWHATAEKCLHEVRENIRLADETGIHILDHQLFASGVYSALDKGDLELAGEYVTKSMMIVSEKRRDGLAQSLFLAGWHSLLTGNISTASSHAERAVNLSIETGIPGSELLCRILTTHIMIKRGEYQQASDQIALAKKIALRIGSKFLINRCLLPETQIAFITGDEKEGLRLLQAGLAAGREINYISMVFHWQPPVMVDLCKRALENGIEVEYAKRNIRELELVPEKPPFHIENWPWPLKIRTFGEFRILRDEKPLQYSRKAPKKPLELLRMLISSVGKKVSEDRIKETLWRDAEGDAAQKALSVTLVRLRELLGVKDVLQVSEGFISLDERYVWIDTRAFTAFLDQARTSEKSGREAEAVRLSEEAIALYRGPFLEGEESAWSISPRERLRESFLTAVEKLGTHWEKKRQWRKAIEVYGKGLDVDDLVEKFHIRVMDCFLALGSSAEALAAYRRLQKTFDSYGVEPSQETQKIYKQITSKQ